MCALGKFMMLTEKEMRQCEWKTKYLRPEGPMHREGHFQGCSYLRVDSRGCW